MRDSDSSTQGACEAAKSSGVRHVQINPVGAKETYQVLRYPAGRVSHLIHGWRCDAMRREEKWNSLKGSEASSRPRRLAPRLTIFDRTRQTALDRNLAAKLAHGAWSTRVHLSFLGRHHSLSTFVSSRSGKSMDLCSRYPWSAPSPLRRGRRVSAVQLQILP